MNTVREDYRNRIGFLWIRIIIFTRMCRNNCKYVKQSVRSRLLFLCHKTYTLSGVKCWKCARI